MKKSTDIDKQILAQVVGLASQLGDLRGEVKTGFKGVHDRQDITNGRVGKLEGRMEKVEEKQTYASGGRNTAKYIISIILAIAAIVVVIIWH